MNWRVVDIFKSVQGEGFYMGRPCVFVRFAGCNLCCPWCDTPDALDDKAGKEYTTPELLLAILNADGLTPRIREDSLEAPYVVFTGGEPLIQINRNDDWKSLAKALNVNSYTIGVETNGTLPIPSDIDWVCVSPKRQSDYEVNSSSRYKIDEIKIVADEPVDVIRACRSINKQLGDDVRFTIQPLDRKGDPNINANPDMDIEGAYKVVKALEKDGITAYLGLQAHKVWRIK